MKESAKYFAPEVHDWQILGESGSSVPWSTTFCSFATREYNVYRLQPDFEYKPKLEVTVKINGKEINPSNISQETWNNIRRES